MKFDMTIEDNFASFKDEAGVAILVDSFDNKNFDVRIGTIEDSELAGTIVAGTNAELNEGIMKLYQKHKGE